MKKLFSHFFFCFLFFICSISFGQLVAEELSPKTPVIITGTRDISSLFSIDADQIQKGLNSIQRMIQGEINIIISIPHEERTFENTILAHDEAIAFSCVYKNLLDVIEMTHPDDLIRTQARISSTEWTYWMIDTFDANKELKKPLKAFIENNLHQKSFSSERIYYMENLLSELTEVKTSDKAKALGLKKIISELSTEFSTNIAEDHSFLSVSKEDLAGVDPKFINTLERNGEEYLLYCDYPTRAEIMRTCSIESTRRDYFRLFNNRAFPKNMEVLTKLINARDELAHLLYFDSFAEMNLKGGMLKTITEVEDFLDNLQLVANENSKEIPSILTNGLPDSISLTSDGKIKPWDEGYLSNIYSQKNSLVVNVDIRDYFPADLTVRRLLDVYEQFFDLKFTVIQNEQFWDPEISLIEVRQEESEQPIIGYILVDLFPRQNKFSHACCVSVIPPISLDKGKTFQPALAVVIANFSKPTENKPSLLKHNEVQTFFHEFGHAIHALLGRSEMPTQGAYNTSLDFVEAPSQLLEEWIYDREILKMISCHYKTGESLPDSIIDALIENKALNKTNQMINSIALSRLALDLFKEGQNKDLDKITRDFYEKNVSEIAYDPEIHFLCSFGHLTGYGPKYYVYAWSEQLALKMFHYIKSRNGLLDPLIGKRYIDKVIGRGGSCDPNDLVRDFLDEEAI